MKIISNKLSLITLLISVWFFASSLFFQCYSTSVMTELVQEKGFYLMIWSWVGVLFDPVAALPWLATPLYIASLFGTLISDQFIKSLLDIKINKPLLFLFAMILLSTIALYFALSFLPVERLFSSGSENNPSSTKYQTGYWLWIGSITILLTAQLLRFIAIKAESA